jgi:hypothetical protein
MSLSALARVFQQRKATPLQLSELFSDSKNCQAILNLDSEVTPKVRGEFVDFLRNEYLSQNGYTLYDDFGKIVDKNFHYSGSSRADVRAVKFDPENPSNMDIYVETCKFKGKAVGVGSSEIEGAANEARKLIRQLGASTARVHLGIVASDMGVTTGLDKWYSSTRQDFENLQPIKLYGPSDIIKWFKNLAVHYKRNNWNYHPQLDETELPPVNLMWHQERLCSRWGLRMIQEQIKLLVIWGCRTGKTYGSLALMRFYIEEYNKYHNSDEKLYVSIVCALPSLFPDWEQSIKDIFGTSALVHVHKSGSASPTNKDKHRFILCSSQMLNEADSENGVDKETNKKVMYSAKFDALIYDEGHIGLTADNTYKQTVKKIKHDHLIGLTATPFRTGLLNDSIFTDRDVFDYWQQMQMKEEGHPDYLNAAERFLFVVKPTPKALKLFKDLDLADLGTNIKSVYNDTRQMSAVLYMLNEVVLAPTNLMHNDLHQVRDIIIRADGVPEGKILLDAMRAYKDPITGKKLNCLIGLATGEISDLPGVEAGFNGISASEFKPLVSAFFNQQTTHERKILILFGQGLTGHTFKSVNTTVDLSSTETLAIKYQFWDRGGTKHTYPDGYQKDAYYHFDFNMFRMLAMAKGMRDAQRADREIEYDDEVFFELLNLFEIENGLNFVHVNQTEFKAKLDRMLSQNKLAQILPSPGDLIVNDGVFEDIDVSKLKNGFGATGFDPTDDESNNDLDKTSASKKPRLGIPVKKSARQNFESNTKNAVDRFVNIIPLLALLESIDR